MLHLVSFFNQARSTRLVQFYNPAIGRLISCPDFILCGSSVTYLKFPTRLTQLTHDHLDVPREIIAPIDTPKSTAG